MTVTKHDLPERIERIERDNRRTRILGCTALVFLAAFLLLGLAKQKPRILEAESIILRDEAGQIRARLEVKDDMQGIGLYDKKGNLRIGVSLAPDGSPIMCLYDEEGQGRVLLEKGFGDSWSLAFSGVEGKDEAVLGVDFKGNPYLHFFDKDGKKIWSAP